MECKCTPENLGINCICTQLNNTVVNVFNENCIETMKRMKENNIGFDLVVTSPPYGYGKEGLRTYNDSSVWTEETFKKVAQGLWETANDGAVVVWVVNDVTIKGSESGDSFRQALYFMELGFKLNDTMIYQKNTASFPSRKGSKRFTPVFEYMFVFVKGKIHDCNLLADKPNKYAGYSCFGRKTHYNKNGELVETEKIKPVPEFSLRNNVWKYTASGSKARHKFGHHPAVFPLQLAKDHILSWSLPEYTIFDPFLGSGTTMDACIETDRLCFIGCEIDKEYFEIIRKKVDYYKGKNLA